MTKTYQKDLEQDIDLQHGMSQESDAIVVVVSEETGKISIAKDGTLIMDVKEEALRQILIKNIVTKRFGNENLKKKRAKWKEKLEGKKKSNKTKSET